MRPELRITWNDGFAIAYEVDGPAQAVRSRP